MTKYNAIIYLAFHMSHIPATPTLSLFFPQLLGNCMSAISFTSQSRHGWQEQFGVLRN